MIVIESYKPEWVAEFEQIRMDLQRVLGDQAVQIDHIGSTSVPNLGAKDIIDLQVTVRDFDPAIIQALQAAGYVYREYFSDHVPLGDDPNPALWEKRYFNNVAGRRKANIHMRKLGNPNQRYPLLFRDYLRAHPQSVLLVEQIKRELARYFADDVEAYYDIKDPVYDLIWDAAQDWAKMTGWGESEQRAKSREQS